MIELVAKPAIRVFGSKSSVRELRLYQRPDIEYSELPRDQLLPLRETVRQGPRPGIERVAQTDAQGDFEFFVGPGEYTLRGPDGVKLEYTPNFVLTNQPALEVSLQQQQVAYPDRKLRVVRQDDPNVPVPNATVARARRGNPGLESSRERVERTGEGTFRDTGANLVFKAASADKALVGSADWNSGGGDVVIVLGSPGSIRGRIVDSSEARLTGTVWFTTDFNGTEEQRRARMIQGQFVKLDDEGRFVFDKLVPGVTYTLRADITYPFSDEPPTNSTYRRGWFRQQWLGPVKAKAGEAVDLGDIAIEP